jgi:hypothetical protein
MIYARNLGSDEITIKTRNTFFNGEDRVNVSAIISKASEIVQTLDGILYRKYVYSLCETVTDLALAYEQILRLEKSSPDGSNYLNFTWDTWLSKIPPQKRSGTETGGETLVGDFLVSTKNRTPRRKIKVRT